MFIYLGRKYSKYFKFKMDDICDVCQGSLKDEVKVYKIQSTWNLKLDSSSVMIPVCKAIQSIFHNLIDPEEPLDSDSIATAICTDCGESLGVLYGFKEFLENCHLQEIHSPLIDLLKNVNKFINSYEQNYKERKKQKTRNLLDPIESTLTTLVDVKTEDLDLDPMIEDPLAFLPTLTYKERPQQTLIEEKVSSEFQPPLVLSLPVIVQVVPNSNLNLKKQKQKRSPKKKKKKSKTSPISQSYPCDFPGCTKSYARKAGLVFHQRYHEDETLSFPCNWEGCNKIFKYVKNLQTHTKLHLGIKEFGCKNCSKCFTRSEHLKRHVERFHFIENHFLRHKVF